MAARVASLGLFLAGCALTAFEKREALKATFQYDSSPIDWCEENYVHHPLIAEFWNSLSSFSMVVVAFIAPRYFGQGVQEHEPNIWILWSLMVLVGIGSILFHGTLSVAGQVLDELPICLLAIFALFMLKPLHKWNPTFRAVVFDWPFFVGLTCGSTIACLLFPVLSHVFTLSFIPTLLYHFITEYTSASLVAKKQAKPVFIITMMSFALAFGCWLVDKFLCHELQLFLGGFNPQLHAWWHVVVSFTFWGLVATGIVLRSNGDGLKVHLQPTNFVLPYVDAIKVV